MNNTWKSVRLGGALIVLLTLVVYLPAMRGGFIWDDALLVNNPLVKAKDGLYRFWFTTEPSDYYPLTWTLSWLEWRLWGNSAVGYHTVNVLLHAINATLVWVILKRLRIRGAWLAALIFALHPVNTATAAWISEQKSTFSMLFYTVTILLYLRFDEEGGWHWYGFSLVAFLLALLSKTAVVMLPFVLLGCVWWRRGRITRKDLLYSCPFIVLSLVLGLVTVWFQYNRALGGYTIPRTSFLSDLAVAGWIPWFYLYKALVPFNLSMIYPRWNIDGSRIISYLPGIILMGCMLLFWWKRKSWGRPLLFGLGYFVVMLFPVLGFFDQGFYVYSLVADHWQYYSIIGVIALAVSAGATFCHRIGERGRYIGPIAAIAVLAILGLSTWRRGGVFQSKQMLWRDTLAKNPDAWIAHYNLGFELANQGKFAEAAAEFDAALQINPDYIPAYNNLGNSLLELGKVTEAVEQYEQALRLKPDHPGAHYNLGNALLRLGKVPEAITQCREALRLRPDFPPALNKLAWILATNRDPNLRNSSEAVQLAERLNASTGGQQTKTLDVLAAAYAEAGRFKDAVQAAQKALDLAMAEGQRELAQQIKGRLKLYQTGRPFHESAALTAPGS
ncbi:MAG: tetratricopeptide repeat protein [Verrucomicrobiia bacterium]